MKGTCRGCGSDVRRCECADTEFNRSALITARNYLREIAEGAEESIGRDDLADGMRCIALAAREAIEKTENPPTSFVSSIIPGSERTLPMKDERG